MKAQTIWQDLLNEMETVRTFGPLHAVWFAYRGSEDHGMWRLHPDGTSAAQRARLSFFAAQAIRNLRIPPIPAPQAEQFCPHWRAICQTADEPARQKGAPLEFEEAVPYGLGTIDSYTRAWLELLRRESRAFRSRDGVETVRGTPYKTMTGTIEDLSEASVVHLLRCARDHFAGLSVAGARSPREILEQARRAQSWDRFAARLEMSRDTLHVVIRETRWISDRFYNRLAEACTCRPEDLHPRGVPRGRSRCLR